MVRKVRSELVRNVRALFGDDRTLANLKPDQEMPRRSSRRVRGSRPVRPAGLFDAVTVCATTMRASSRSTPKRCSRPISLIVLGGPIGVYETDTYPFIADEIDGDRSAAFDAGRPTLGICLGAQMMAAALGARVAPGPVKEIGWAPLQLDRRRPEIAAGAARRDAGAALARRQLRVAGRLRPARFDAALSGAGSSRRARLSSRCSFIWRPSRCASRPGSSATPSNSARPASIRAPCASRRANSGPATCEAGRKVLSAWLDKVDRMTSSRSDRRMRSKMPALRGRLLANQSLAELTWFRVGGPAQALFIPEDEDDLG